MLKPLNAFPMKLVLLHQYKAKTTSRNGVCANDLSFVLEKQSRSTRRFFPVFLWKNSTKLALPTLPAAPPSPLSFAWHRLDPNRNVSSTTTKTSSLRKSYAPKIWKDLERKLNLKNSHPSKCFKQALADSKCKPPEFQHDLLPQALHKFYSGYSAPPKTLVASFSGATCVASPRDVKIPISMPTSVPRKQIFIRNSWPHNSQSIIQIWSNFQHSSSPISLQDFTLFLPLHLFWPFSYLGSQTACAMVRQTLPDLVVLVFSKVFSKMKLVWGDPEAMTLRLRQALIRWNSCSCSTVRKLGFAFL